MKIFLRLFLGVTLLTPMLAAAELIIYKGSLTDAFNGLGRKTVQTRKLILIVDYHNVQASVISYSTGNSVKNYKVTPLVNAHFVQVRGASGDYTAIARTPSQCDIDSGATGENVYFNGRDAGLTLDTNVVVAFPKIMNGRSGIGLAYSISTGQPALAQGAWKVGFDPAGTRASNQARETLDTAQVRYTDVLESLGYMPL